MAEQTKPNYNPIKNPEDLGREIGERGLKIFDRQPIAREVGEANPVFSTESTPALYVKLRGKLYKVNLTAV